MLIEFGNVMNLELNFTAQNLAKAIKDHKIRGVYETSPCFASMIVHYEPEEIKFHELKKELLQRLVHVVAISPLADLRPLLKTTMNKKLKLNLDTAKEESPVLHTKLNVPFTIFVGEKERPAFLSQATSLSEAWSCSKIITNGQHHFNILDHLENKRSKLVELLTRIQA